jgi:hypothetical protein
MCVCGLSQVVRHSRAQAACLHVCGLCVCVGVRVSLRAHLSCFGAFSSRLWRVARNNSRGGRPRQCRRSTCCRHGCCGRCNSARRCAGSGHGVEQRYQHHCPVASTRRQRRARRPAVLRHACLLKRIHVFGHGWRRHTACRVSRLLACLHPWSACMRLRNQTHNTQPHTRTRITECPLLLTYSWSRTRTYSHLLHVTTGTMCRIFP